MSPVPRVDVNKLMGMQGTFAPPPKGALPVLAGPSASPAPVAKNTTPVTPEQIRARAERCEYGRPVYHSEFNDLVACVGSLIQSDNPNDALLSSYVPLTVGDFESMMSAFRDYRLYGYMTDESSALRTIVGPFPTFGQNRTVAFKMIMTMLENGTVYALDAKTKHGRGLPIKPYFKAEGQATKGSTPVYFAVLEAGSMYEGIDKLGGKKLEIMASRDWLTYAKSRGALEYDDNPPRNAYIGIWYNFRDNANLLRKAHDIRYPQSHVAGDNRVQRMASFTNNVFNVYDETLNKYLARATANTNVLDRLADDYARLPPEEAYKALYCYMKKRSLLFVYTLNSSPDQFDVEMVYLYHLSYVPNGWLLIGTVKRGAASATAKDADNTASYVEMTIKNDGTGTYSIDYNYVERKSSGQRQSRPNTAFKRWALYLRRTSNDLLGSYSGLVAYHQKMRDEGRLGPGGNLTKLSDVPSSAPKTKRGNEGKVRSYGDEAPQPEPKKVRIAPPVLKAQAPNPSSMSDTILF